MQIAKFLLSQKLQLESILYEESIFILYSFFPGLCSRHYHQGHNEGNAYITQNSNGHFVLLHDSFLLLWLSLRDNTIQLSWVYEEDFPLNKTLTVLLRGKWANFETFLHGKTSWLEVKRSNLKKHHTERNELKMITSTRSVTEWEMNWDVRLILKESQPYKLF